MSTIHEENDEAFVEEEEQEAAQEAAGIGGDVQQDSDDPAEAPVLEGGGGESEGFELAEKDLEDIAEHGDEHRFPDAAVGASEEAGADTTYGEADQEISADGSDDGGE
jgi:hypothetical protein